MDDLRNGPGFARYIRTCSTVAVVVVAAIFETEKHYLQVKLDKRFARPNEAEKDKS